MLDVDGTSLTFQTYKLGKNNLVVSAKDNAGKIGTKTLSRLGEGHSVADDVAGGHQDHQARQERQVLDPRHARQGRCR